MRERLLATPVLGAAAALLSWNVEFVAPAPYLDPSWQAGLAMAAREGMNWGAEIVYTYGPLGFMRDTRVWFGDQAVLAYLYAAAVHVALACTLLAALRAWLGTALAFAAAVCVLAVPYGVDEHITLALAAGYLVLSRRNLPPRALAAGIALGALFAAVETLAKVSVGPPVALIGFVSLAFGAGRRPAAAFAGVYVAALLALWLAAGQDLATLPDFARETARIVAGHGEAMALDVVPGWWQAAAVVTVIGVALASMRGRYKSGGARIAGTALALVVAFVVFKQAAIRFDEPHLGVFFATAAVFWLVLPWRPSAQVLGLGGGLALTLMSLYVFDPGGRGVFNLAANVGLAGQGALDLAAKSRRTEITEDARAEMVAAYGIEPEVLAALEGRAVAVEPSEVAAVWAHQLDWRPLPVFVNRAAYTPALDDLNADATASADGPEAILRANTLLVDPLFPTGAIDGRYRGWDSPAQQREVLCHFAPQVTAPRWQVAVRVRDRCGEPRLLRRVEAAYGEVVPVPAGRPRDVVYARIEGAEVAGLERVRSLLFAPEIHFAVLDGAATYRLIRATASQGLLLRGPAEVARGPYAQVPQAETIELTGGDGALRFHFYAMPLRPAPARGAPRPPGTRPPPG